MAEISWTLHSKDDLQNIFDYIRNDSEVYALRVVERIIEATYILEKFPKAGRVVPELNRNDIRELFSGNYRIVYRILPANDIDIITVHHGARLLNLDVT